MNKVEYLISEEVQRLGNILDEIDAKGAAWWNKGSGSRHVKKTPAGYKMIFGKLRKLAKLSGGKDAKREKSTRRVLRTANAAWWKK